MYAAGIADHSGQISSFIDILILDRSKLMISKAVTRGLYDHAHLALS